jgi:very-short-patch-repair endonuclease
MRRNMSEGCQGRVVTEETRELLRKWMTGRKLGPLSQEVRRRMGISHARAISEGKYPKTNTIPHQILREWLKLQGKESTSEVRFGRYCVDEYVEEEHIAYEADGTFWHSLPSVIEKDKRRDRELFEQYGVVVIRITEASLLKWRKDNV